MISQVVAGFRVEPLNRQHDRAGFSCGVTSLDDYLRRQARQDADRHLAGVFVFTPDGKRIAAFFTLSAHSILRDNLPEDLARKLPTYPLPVTLLGRLGVDISFQGQGLGSLVLVHALRLALEQSKTVGSLAVVVDAKQGARSFYVRHGFVPLPTQPDRLFLMMEDALKLF